MRVLLLQNGPRSIVSVSSPPSTPPFSLSLPLPLPPSSGSPRPAVVRAPATRMVPLIITWGVALPRSVTLHNKTVYENIKKITHQFIENAALDLIIVCLSLNNTGSEPLISMHFVPLYTHCFSRYMYMYIHVHEAAHKADLRKSDCLGCAVLLCLVVCLTLLVSFFLHSASLINMYCTCTVCTLIFTELTKC